MSGAAAGGAGRAYKVWARAALALGAGLLAVGLHGCESGAKNQAVDVSVTCTDGSEGGPACTSWHQTGTLTLYNIDVTMTCADGTPPACKSWRQQGALITPPQQLCFPGDAVVQSRRGPIPLSEVRPGDELLGLDPSTGTPSFSAVRGWLHRDTESVAPMLAIVTEVGKLVASHGHNVATPGAKPGSVRYVFARDLAPGHTLVAANRSSVRVLSISSEEARGFYSPWTGHSNFFVGASADSLVLAHSFAHVGRPEWAQVAVDGIMAVAEYFDPRIHEVDYDSDVGYVHPVMRVLAPLGGVNLPTTGAPKRILIDSVVGPGEPRRLVVVVTNNNNGQKGALVAAELMMPFIISR